MHPWCGFAASPHCLQSSWEGVTVAAKEGEDDEQGMM